MIDRVVDSDGAAWVTTARGADELGPDITVDRIRDWTRRSRTAGDPLHGLLTPRIHRGRAWYNLADLRRVEAHTADRTRPRARQVDDETPARSQSHSTTPNLVAEPCPSRPPQGLTSQRSRAAR